MASTINAQTTPFAAVVTTADDTGNLALQTANVTAVTIDTNQNATFANVVTATTLVGSANASSLSTGTVPTARLATGTANSSTYLRGDSTWATVPSTTPGGSNTYVQYNNAGAFGGDSGFVYTGGNVGIGTSSPTERLDVVVPASTDGYSRVNTTSSNVGVGAKYSLAGTEYLRLYADSTQTGIFGIQAVPLTFKTSNSERARISSAGGLSVGTTADPGAGAIYATGNITAYYSDDRLKTKLGGIENALDKVKALSGFYYEANQTAQDLGYQAVREVGVSAQQVQAVMPEVVKPAPIDQQYLTVDYERLVPLLIEAIKELEEKVAKLEAK